MDGWIKNLTFVTNGLIVYDQRQLSAKFRVELATTLATFAERKAKQKYELNCNIMFLIENSGV